MRIGPGGVERGAKPTATVAGEGRPDRTSDGGAVGWEDAATRLDAVLRQLGEGVILTDAEGRIEFVNDAAREIHGRAELNVPVEEYTNTYHLLTTEGAPHPPEELALARAVRHGETVVDAEWRIVRPDGTEVLAQGSAAPVYAPDGTRIGSVLTVRDITVQRDALGHERAMLEDAERRANEESALRRAAEAMAEVFSIEEVIEKIAVTATQAVEADAAFVEQVDADADRIEVVAAVGSGAPAIGTLARYDGSVLQRVLERRQPELIESNLETRMKILPELGESGRDGYAMVVPLLNAGEATGALVLARGRGHGPFHPDEIDRARTFGHLAALAFRKVYLLRDSEEKRKELESLMESRTRLVRGFSHDLKNPLGAVDGQLQLLELGIKGELTDEQRASVTRARMALAGALRLIEDLVELARAEAGRLEIEWQPVDVREVAHELTEDYRAPAEAKGLAVRLEFSDELPMIVSDARRLRQILGNLLSNAVKYTNAGSITVAIRRDDRAGPDGGQRIDVIDTGVGIPASEIPLLFHEFTRLDSGEQPGAGLGLAISQRVAHALGGRILVESEPGRGSTFSLVLPERPPGEPAG